VKKVILAAAALVALAASPAAANWSGYADTGYRFRDKRSCCEEAILAAQDDSIANCEGTGGFPVVSRGSSARGQCDWDKQNGVYRCTATATVRCR